MYLLNSTYEILNTAYNYHSRCLETVKTRIKNNNRLGLNASLLDLWKVLVFEILEMNFRAGKRVVGAVYNNQLNREKIRADVLNSILKDKGYRTLPQKAEMFIRNQLEGKMGEGSRKIFILQNNEEKAMRCVTIPGLPVEFVAFVISPEIAERVEKEGMQLTTAASKVETIIEDFFIDQNIDPNEITIQPTRQGSYSDSRLYLTEKFWITRKTIHLASRSWDRIEKEGRLNEKDMFCLLHEYSHLKHEDLKNRLKLAKVIDIAYLTFQTISLGTACLRQVGLLKYLIVHIGTNLVFNFINKLHQTKEMHLQELNADAFAAKFGKHILLGGKQDFEERMENVQMRHLQSERIPIPSEEWSTHPDFLTRHSALEEIEKECYPSHSSASCSSSSSSSSCSSRTGLIVKFSFNRHAGVISLQNIYQLKEEIRNAPHPFSSREFLAQIWNFYNRYEKLNLEYDRLPETNKQELDHLKKRILVKSSYSPSSRFENILRRTMNVVIDNSNPQERELLIRDLRALQKNQSIAWDSLNLDPTFLAMMNTKEGQRLSLDYNSTE